MEMIQRPTSHIYVNITEEDIRLGIRRDRAFCPIARAVSRKLDKGWYAAVDSKCVSVYRTLIDKTSYQYELSQRLQAWIAAYDGGINTIRPTVGFIRLVK